MPNSHIDNSEIVLGLMIEGRQPKHGFSPEHFDRTYTKLAADIIAGRPVEELIPLYGSNTIQSCIHAAHSVNGLGESADWRSIIQESYNNQIASVKLKRLQKNLEQGISTNPDDVREAFQTIMYPETSKSIRASEVGENYTPFVPSGMGAWDTHIGGFPAVGLVILAGVWSSGKTTNAITLIDAYLRQYPDREALFVTLEDMNEGWKDRAITVLGKRSVEFWERVHLMEFAKDAGDIIAEAEQLDKVGLIITDYVDYLARGKDLEAYEDIYKTLSMGAKQLAVRKDHRNMTIIALAQLGKTMYKGGVPREGDIPYTGQQYAYQIAMMYNANSDFHSDNAENPYVLPAVPGYNYLVFWKVKNGCRPHENEFPGAIQLPWSNRYGFALDNDGRWFPLTPETKRATQTRRKG